MALGPEESLTGDEGAGAGEVTVDGSVGAGADAVESGGVELTGKISWVVG